MTSPIDRSPRAILGALLLAATLAACGSPDGQTSPGTSVSGPSGGFPVQVLSGEAGSETTVTIENQPEAIVSLSPTATETLFAIGAGDQVVAVDDQSNYPQEAPKTNLSGYQPNVEAILNYSPDLVVTATPDPDTVASLEKAGVPTLVLPAVSDFNGVYDQIERLGAATGQDAGADGVVADVKSRIDAAVASAPQVSDVSYFHELDSTLYTVTSESFIGQVYTLFGLTNIADAAPGAGGYPQLSEEYVVESNPDVIFLADASYDGVTVEQVGQRPGWSEITAVQQNQIYVLDSDLASRWGPRVADYVEAVAGYVSELNLVNA